MSKRVALTRKVLENGPLRIKPICNIISEFMEGPSIIGKFKQRVALAYDFLEAGPLPVKGVCDIILEFLAAPDLIRRRTWPTAGWWVNKLCVMPNGHFAASGQGGMVAGCYGGEVTFYDASQCACLLKLDHANSVTALASFPDGRLASGSSDTKVRVWENGECLLTLAGHHHIVSSLAVMPDGTLASSSWDRTIRVWNTTHGVCLVTLRGHTNRVYPLAAMPDGKLASGSDDGTVRLWDPARGVCVLTIDVVGVVSAVGVLPNGDLITASVDGMIRAWDANGACVLTFDGSCNSKTSLVVCSDGCLLSSNFGGYVHGWDSTTGESLFSIEVEAHKIIAFAVLPDGGLVTASSEYEIQVWE